MGSKLLASLEPENIQEASALAEQFMNEFVGRNLDIAGATTVMMLEFIIRHTHISMDDVVEAVELLADYNESRNELGSMTMMTKIAAAGKN